MSAADLALSGIDAGLRGALIALLLQLAAVLWRDRPGSALARIGLALAAGLSVQAVSSAPLFEARVAWAWQVPAIGVSTANALLFWLLARVLFDDSFRLRPAHAGGWLAVVGLSTLRCTVAAQPGAPAWVQGLGDLARWLPALFALLAAHAALAHWRDDLVEGRRRFRGLVVAAGCLYTVAMVLARLAAPTGRLPGLVALADTAALLAQVALLSWRLQRADGVDLYPPLRAGQVPAAPGLSDSLTDSVPDSRLTPEPAPQLDPPPEPGTPPTPGPALTRPAELAAAVSPTPTPTPTATPSLASTPDPAEDRLAEALQHLMTERHLYREENLSVARLAQHLGAPAYRLRRLINQRLGHRNFSAYINGYRLAEAQAALADPARRERPVLSIALDAGFQSIGPFNRAFKAATGQTPTEFRQEKLADS